MEKFKRAIIIRKLLTSLAFLFGILSFTVSDDIPSPVQRPLKIGAFNIQVFGKRKMDNEQVVPILLKIIERYDIVLIQEIRDKSQEALPELVKLLNGKDSVPTFDYVVSDPLGRSTSKEQYAFIYRRDRVIAASTYQYPDPKDVFEREPYAVRFKSSHTEVPDFGIIAIHTSPKSAVQEIDHLTDVYDKVSKEWNLEDIMIAGDFNADCHYVSRKEERTKISLYNDTRFEWLIGPEEDTTVGDSDCSYDRFVVAGKALYDAILPGSVHVYNFDDEDEHNIDKALALKVSDHYPIELQISGKENKEVTKGNTVAKEVICSGKSGVLKSSIEKIYTDRKYLIPQRFKINRYKENNRNELYVVSKICTSKQEVEQDLKQFRQAHPRGLFEDLITKEQISLVKQFLESESMDVPGHVNGLSTNAENRYKMKIECVISERRCDIQISRIVFKG